MKTILIIEDDQDISNMLKQLLEVNHYQVVQAFSGTEGILLHNQNISLILLDLMLPGKNGKEIISQLISKTPVPIIVMSAIHDISKKIDLCNLGVDSYIIKPFDNTELLARIKIQLKHQKEVKNKILIFKDITLDVQNYTVTCNMRNVNLTKYEFGLLKTLMEHPNQIFTKSMLFEIIWGEASADDNTLNVHISKIRNKLKDCNPKIEYIETVWSIGYKMKN